jgi:endonuclease/exonuclease/phosphatase family metal-dependent hydrolase
MRGRFAFIAVYWACVAMPADAALLRVLTYNIHHGVGNDSALNLSRIADVILSANADIVSLQEVDHGVPRSGSVEQMNRLAELTGMTGYFGKARNLDGGAYGNGVLVKPGIDVVSVVNRALPNPDDVEPRALLELNLSVDANPTTAEFKFFATHLMHDSGAGRTASVNYINDLVSTSTAPSILAGDMNIRPDYTAYGLLQEEWSDVTNINNSGKNRDNQIDYIFVRSSDQWNVVTRSQFIVNATTNVASDHHPLLAVVELGETALSTLVWNDNSGLALGVSSGFATGNASQGVGVYPSSPWENGAHALLLGYGGKGTFTGNASRTAAALHIGTDRANAVIAGRNGDGTMTASNSVSLTLVAGGNASGDFVVGEGGYRGTLNWNSTGTLAAQGEVHVGDGGVGEVFQTKGTVTYELGLTIGSGAEGTGLYSINDGTLTTASSSGVVALDLGSDGGVGTLRVAGNGTVAHRGALQLAGGADRSGSGRLEVIGSAANVRFNQLANADGRLEGGSEAMFWQADASGVTPLVIEGSGGGIVQPVQLQHPEELAANTGGGGLLSGDGIALQLDLTALSDSHVITLIDNRSSQPITGFFENGASGMLYDEGAELLGLGFNGTVTISYQGSSGVGSAGNDVILQLTAASDPADFDGDGDVDGADFLVWQRGERDPARLELWKSAFGRANSAQLATVIPEPTTSMLCAAALLVVWLRKHR